MRAPGGGRSAWSCEAINSESDLYEVFAPLAHLPSSIETLELTIRQ